MKKILVIAAAAMVCLGMGRLFAQAPDAGVNGKWHFVLETPGGDREVDADLTVDPDGNVTGKWGTADVAGTYKDGKLALEFQFTSEEVGATAAMKIDGKLDETASLTGDWAFSEYNGTYKATRPTAPDAGTAPAAAPGPNAAPAPPAPNAAPAPPADSKPNPQ